MTLSSVEPVAPGDLIATGSLVSVAGWLGSGSGCRCGLGLVEPGSCGVELSIALPGGKGVTACGSVGIFL